MPLVANNPGRRGFHQGDLDVLAAFSAQAAPAQRLAQHRAHTEELHLLEERDRIARELHDHVIQEVFAAGPSLSNIASTASVDQKARMVATVRELDQVIRDIRGTIFDLHSPPAPKSEAAPGLRRALTEIVRTTTATVQVTATPVAVTARIEDDGDGIGDTTAPSCSPSHSAERTRRARGRIARSAFSARVAGDGDVDAGR